MAALGHSLQGRPSGKFSHVRCDADSGSSYGALATPRQAIAGSWYGRGRDAAKPGSI